MNIYMHIYYGQLEYKIRLCPYVINNKDFTSPFR